MDFSGLANGRATGRATAEYPDICKFFSNFKLMPKELEILKELLNQPDVVNIQWKSKQWQYRIQLRTTYESNPISRDNMEFIALSDVV